MNRAPTPQEVAGFLTEFTCGFAKFVAIILLLCITVTSS